MPHLLPFASPRNDDALHVQEDMGGDPLLHRWIARRSPVLDNVGSFLKVYNDTINPFPRTIPAEHSQLPSSEYVPIRRRSLQDITPLREALPSLPRLQTLHRQESEKRENLLQVQQDPVERRAWSVDRRRGLSASAARRPWTSQPVPGPALTPTDSLPDANQADPSESTPTGEAATTSDVPKPHRHVPSDLPALQIPFQPGGPIEANNEYDNRETDHHTLREEYEQRWILNLGMHFRDKSQREKFFVTYAEQPNRWRRITISLDYRNALEGSLEADLKNLHYQRDKSFRIYEAIAESLPAIKYYDTVTNLKLETTPEDGQLHVHVREDGNEIIHYPSTSLFQHVQARRIAESDIEFISHLSGFVYKVRAEGAVVIKKEIPGPDTIDEFLYEVNALDSLQGCDNVVQLRGLVTDDAGTVVKGLLISYASQGALIDMIYDFRDTRGLPWHRREKWARQIVHGLTGIHEAGFVQGDFTLSNIVVDEHDNAHIIDINRRGCPVGWEPPELSRLIQSGQRIAMCIGVKTDLFQLGMVLWALAEVVDEPERVERPLPPIFDQLPLYFRDMVATCLSTSPQLRSCAKELLQLFPPYAGMDPSSLSPPPPPSFLLDQAAATAGDLRLSDNSVSTSHRSDKEYIDPSLAMTIDDVRRGPRRRQQRRPSSHSPLPSDRMTSSTADFASGQVIYVVDPTASTTPASTSYRLESSGSWAVGGAGGGGASPRYLRPGRGRSPLPREAGRRRSSPYARTLSSATSVSDGYVGGRELRLGPAEKGSEGSGVEDAGDGAFGVKCTLAGYPCEIGEEDLRPLAGMGGVAREAGAQDGEEDERVGGVKLDASSREGGVALGRLLHTDSGFDERMVMETLCSVPDSTSAAEQKLADNDKVEEGKVAEGKVAEGKATESLGGSMREQEDGERIGLVNEKVSDEDTTATKTLA